MEVLNMKRYLIETLLPLKELSAEAKREKAIRHGHISTLHVWWARRPLVVSRAAVFGALVPDDEEVTQKFIANLCKWEVHDGSREGSYLLEQARALIRKRFLDSPPNVLDSFAGGGSIPLEALRLGCESHALEYNPVAYVILKATLEYPQKYGKRLVEEVRRWGVWVLERARYELAQFYPAKDGKTPIAYIWSRTISCQNPSCGAEIPLFRQFWLARKANKKVALKPVVNRIEKKVEFEIVEGKSIDFDPSEGTVRRGIATCLVCGGTANDRYVKAEAQAGRMGQRLIAVVETSGKGKGRDYRLSTEEDLLAFQKASDALEQMKQTPSPWAFGLPWVPEEIIKPSIGNNFTVSGNYPWGIRSWGNLFNPRQLLALCTFGKWVREAYQEILKETNDSEFAKAVLTYLGFCADFIANRGSILCFWDSQKELFYQTFATHALKMAWDYAESNVLSGSIGSWGNAIRWIFDFLQRESRIGFGKPLYGSAVSLPIGNNFFDAVIIDPPYADNVPYADLSDFFYVWLRRTIGDLYPEAFSTDLTPKDEEAVVNPARWGGGKKGEKIGQAHYERLMRESFSEIHRVLKPEGISVVMFTHRSTSAWERLIQSLLDAGLYPTASFPVHTEMEASTHQRGKGAVQSTILMACRPRPKESRTGWYHQIRSELAQVVRERLSEFWEAGIRGADFFISAIGPAIGVFGRYEKVLRPDGKEVEVSELLDEVRTLVSEYALERLGKGLGFVDAPSRFYILYRWAYGIEILEFDEANKLSKSQGVELDALTNSYRLANRKGDKISVPIFLDRLREEQNIRPLRKAVEDGKIQVLPFIDLLHLILFFWKRGETDGLTQILALAGLQDKDHTFWRMAQSLHDVEREWQNSGLSEEITALAQLLPASESLTRRALRVAEEGRQLKFEF